MEGLFYSARTIREGIDKIYTVLGLRQYPSDGDDGLYASLFNMLKIEGKQIAPNTFIVTQQAGDREAESLVRYSNKGGTKMMSSIYGDQLEADSDVRILIVAIVLYAIAVLWSVSTLINGLTRFIIRKCKKEGRHMTFSENIRLCFVLLLYCPLSL